MKNRALWLTLTALIAGLASLWLLESAHAADDAQADAAGVQRIIVFKKGISPADRIRRTAAAGGTIVHDLGLINAVAVRFPSGRVKLLEAALLANPDVLRIDEDFKQKWIETSVPSFQETELPQIHVGRFKVRSRFSESDPTIPWGVARVNAPNAWGRTKGAGAKVAIIDTGIDYNHSQLKANIKGGWNAIAKTDDFMDDHGHGTHVSGTIAAVRNGLGVSGVAPEAGLWGVKVLDANGSGTFADVIAGIQWAADHHMDVANMSLGASQGNDSLKEAVTAAAKAGLAIIAAAGNSGGPVGYPAAYPECIAVSASDSSDRIASFSSFGPEVALIAPGVDVYSTYMGGGYETLSGTSMATPHVAGLSALAVAAKGVHGVDTIRAALKGAATPLPDLNPAQQGAGLVDAEKLVR